MRSNASNMLVMARCTLTGQEFACRFELRGDGVWYLAARLVRQEGSTRGHTGPAAPPPTPDRPWGRRSPPRRPPQPTPATPRPCTCPDRSTLIRSIKSAPTAKWWAPMPEASASALPADAPVVGTLLILPRSVPGVGTSTHMTRTRHRCSRYKRWPPHPPRIAQSWPRRQHILRSATEDRLSSAKSTTRHPTSHHTVDRFCYLEPQRGKVACDSAGP
jgi:hypothetical protein